ncbi:response regulator transcription factor [Sulfurovum sp.]|uniref:response regulator transcription factor n=1 Tax=Sulfurovum sp. TaxID=1969726 RepID=UPI00286802D4|nr:response regulator transcription factor [Sulfurovum sp.]
MDNLSELTLLYIEDDNNLREQFVRILRPRFKHIYEAVDGLDALEKYKIHSPDMMLVDINIPKVDGLEVVELIRKHDNHTPIVVLSAYSDQTKLLKAIKLGLSDYLIKPIPQKKLISIFEELAVTFKARANEEGLIVLKNGYSWKKEEKILYHHKMVISLTKRESILLDFMIQQCNTVIPCDNITNLIWEDETYAVAYSSLSHLLKRLRKKLPEELIENIYGEGYKVISK